MPLEYFQNEVRGGCRNIPIAFRESTNLIPLFVVTQIFRALFVSNNLKIHFFLIIIYIDFYSFFFNTYLSKLRLHYYIFISVFNLIH